MLSTMVFYSFMGLTKNALMILLPVIVTLPSTTEDESTKGNLAINPSHLL